MTTALASPKNVRDDLRLGGRYRAIDNGDGTYDIKDVAVFAEVPAGAKRNKDHIGRDWQERAIIKNQARESEGHLPPVHVYHSDDTTVKPIHAGKLRLKDLRQITYQGERIWATFGDIIGMPAEVFEKVKRGFLPYRSVEIHNWDNEEIDALALMDTDVPYFRMEMLTIGEVVKRFKNKEADMFMGKGRTPAVACRVAEAHSMAILFKFDDKKKSDDDKGDDALEESEDTATPPDTAKDPAAEEPAPAGDPDATAGEDPDALMEDADTDGDGSPDGDGPPSPEMPGGEAEMGAQPMDPSSLLQAIKSAVDQILERIAPQAPAEEMTEPVSGFSDKESTMANDPKAPQKAGTAPATMKAEDIRAMFSEQLERVVNPLKEKVTLLETENTTLRAKHDAAEKAVAVDARFRAAREKLEAKRIVVTDKMAEHLKAGAAISDEFLGKQVELFMEITPTDPAPDVETFESELATGKDGVAMSSKNAGVQKFMDENPGPDMGKWVAAEMAKFKVYKAAAPSSDVTAEDWLRTNLRAVNMYENNKV